jgi:SAM-dependent methyltransferase
MSIDRTRRIAFEEQAELYDQVRPGYPEALIDDVIALSAIPPGGRILEIGCGPGNATLPFARRGHPILAVELGEKLSALARRNLADFPQVEIVTAAFEDWPVQDSAFDLALSADAFHWIVPEIGYPKVRRALKPGRCLAFFWNAPAAVAAPWMPAVDEVYRRLAPQAVNPENRFSPDWVVETVSGTIRECGCFEAPQVRQYDIHQQETPDQYIGNLWTFSSHRDLDPALRRQLYAGIRQVLDAFGGLVDVPHSMVLFVARTRAEK